MAQQQQQTDDCKKEQAEGEMKIDGEKKKIHCLPSSDWLTHSFLLLVLTKRKLNGEREREGGREPQRGLTEMKQ